MNKKLMTFGVVSVLALVLVSAALLTYFGQAITTVNVEQGIYLDGNSWNVPVENDADITSLGGVVYTSHLLTNEADMDAELCLVTTCSADVEPESCDEVETTYWELFHTWTRNQDDFSKQDYMFDMEVVNNEDGSLTWTVNDNDGMSASYPMGTVTVFDEDGNAKYHVGYNTANPSGVYSVYDSGWSNEAMPSGFVLSSTNDDFSVTIPSDAIESGDRLAFNVERIGVGSAVNARYPTDWSWQGVLPSAVSRVDSVEMYNPITLYSEDELDFAIKSVFPYLTIPGEYVLTTSVEPCVPV
jgi:hypothetical protein